MHKFSYRYRLSSNYIIYLEGFFAALAEYYSKYKYSIHAALRADLMVSVTTHLIYMTRDRTSEAMKRLAD